MKRKTAEERLGMLVQELGLEKAEAAFRLLRSYAHKTEPKQRKKTEKPIAMEAKAS